MSGKRKQGSNPQPEVSQYGCTIISKPRQCKTGPNPKKFAAVFNLHIRTGNDSAYATEDSMNLQQIHILTMPGTKPAATPNLHRPNHSSRGGSRDGKGLLSDTNRQKDHNAPSVSKPKPTSSDGEKLLKDPKTNDFAQERLWKTTAAAQLCHQVSFTSRLRFEMQNKNLEMKMLSHTVAKAVMQFWHSVELLLDKDVHDHNSVDSRSHGISSQAEAPTTPDKIFDSGTVDMSWEEHLTEESLFYQVPHTAMETYRKSIESHFLQCEKTGISIQEEVETSIYDTGAEFGCEDVAYDEDEGETSTYYLLGTYESRRSLKSVQKKHKNRIKAYTQRAIEIGTDLPYAHYSTGAHPSVLSGSRSANLNVGTVPTRRLRTASRRRVVSPFAVVTGTVQALAKTDAASSGDSNSFQDDQYTLHVGSQLQKSMEVESVGDFEKQSPYDHSET
ncbi:hypothetical protein KIW84_051706 [Lathyrus oleraceus]|uniref:Uncharacterized protein n=1 Tax=Pisum sativum TaxID=3888 RepID=A0A9D4WLS2_PEA|nr:hypothetical protein KIW84_051706 [Pisum sativum]